MRLVRRFIICSPSKVVFYRNILHLEMAEQHDARATLNLARNIVHKLQDVLNVNDAIEILDDS